MELREMEDLGTVVVSRVYWNDIPTPLELRWYIEDNSWSVWMRKPDECRCLARGLPLRVAKRLALRLLQGGTR